MGEAYVGGYWKATLEESREGTGQDCMEGFYAGFYGTSTRGRKALLCSVSTVDSNAGGDLEVWSQEEGLG